MCGPSCSCQFSKLTTTAPSHLEVDLEPAHYGQPPSWILCLCPPSPLHLSPDSSNPESSACSPPRRFPAPCCTVAWLGPARPGLTQASVAVRPHRPSLAEPACLFKLPCVCTLFPPLECPLYTLPSQLLNCSSFSHSGPHKILLLQEGPPGGPSQILSEESPGIHPSQGAYVSSQM